MNDCAKLLKSILDSSKSALEKVDSQPSMEFISYISAVVQKRQEYVDALHELAKNVTDAPNDLISDILEFDSELIKRCEQRQKEIAQELVSQPQKFPRKQSEPRIISENA